MKFKIEDYKKIQPTDELTEYLDNYPGIIPMLLLPYCNREQYDNNLKKNGIYDDIYREYYKIRVEYKKSNDKREYRENELLRWIKQNPKIEQILIGGIKNE